MAIALAVLFVISPLQKITVPEIDQDERDIYKIALDSILNKRLREIPEIKLNNVGKYCAIIKQGTAISEIEPSKTDWSTSKDTVKIKYAQYYWNYIAEEAKMADIKETEIISSFISRNSLPGVHKGAVQNSEKYNVVTITELEISELRGWGSFWDRFYIKYPYAFGLVNLSRVGFNSDKTEGMLYIGYSWGRLAGRGYLMKFRKINGQWIITNESLMWLS